MAEEKKEAYLFPADHKALAHAMAVSLDMGKHHQRGRMITWLIHYFYLEGIREFPLINVGNGSVKIRWVTNDGRVPFKYPGALKQHMTEEGRLLQIDTDPLVQATGEGMTVHRDRALAQVTADAMTDPQNRDEAKQHVINLLLPFGTAGLAPNIYGSPETGYHAELEAIPPWELTPIPHAPFSRAQLQGLNRDRFIPISEAIKKYGKDKLQNNYDDLEVMRLPFGEFTDKAMEDSAISPSGVHDTASDFTKAKDPKNTLKDELMDDSYMSYLHLHEMWLTGRGGELRRYVVRSGKVILRDDHYAEGERMAMPVRISRYADTGGFYGASYADLTVGLNREAEKNIYNLLQNARSMDRYGFLVLPSDMGASMKTHTQDQGNGLRLIFYQPSQFADKQQHPQVVAPATTSNFPGDVAAFIVNQLNQMTKDSSLTLPARTDSPNAIQMIDEAARRPITQTVESIAQQFGGVYRYIVMNAGEFYAQNAPVYLSEIDDNLAGVVLDQATGQVKLSVANQPSVNGLKFTIRSSNPREREVLTQQISSLIQIGAMDPGAFQFLNIKHKLRLPFPETPETNTYKTAMLNNILLFNDGQTPGQVLGSGLVDSPRIAMMAIANFMTRPFFKYASIEVRTAFEQLFMSYQLALTVPKMQPMDQPPPEDIMQRGEESQQQPSPGSQQ